MSKKNEYGYCAKCKKELTQMGALLWDNSGVVCSKCDMELMIVPNLKTYYAGTTFSSSHKKTKLTPMTEEEEYRNAGITKEEINKDKKSAYDMSDKEVVKVVDPFLDVSDFNDDGSDIETLRDILENNYDK